MKYIYNKLVRDKIPHNINNIEGKTATFRTLNEKEYKEELDKKLIEEVNEFLENHDIEELADVMEVIDAIVVQDKIKVEDVKKIQKEKREKKGAFLNKIYLEYVEED